MSDKPKEENEHTASGGLDDPPCSAEYWRAVSEALKTCRERMNVYCENEEYYLPWIDREAELIGVILKQNAQDYSRDLSR